ncbi:21945_t:CDS:1 [Gigaspora margarita]|uniref:21945_t:CDS:1 n=1 Tax=Gigaspora margarita TaxID=4874 RepID=A0ABN7VUF5_GIGMA|nr:21945_t:CDS:1 [Gigaspora margarita]
MVEEKCKAVELARCSTNTNAANYYSLDLTMLGRWVNKFSLDPSVSLFQRNSLSIGSGRHAFFPEEKAKLYEWIMEVRQNSLAVTYTSIKLKIAKILDESVKQTNDVSKKLAINKFKLSTH